MRIDSRVPVGCAGVTGASIETALAYGCRQEASRWARWLISIQRPDGGISCRLCDEGGSNDCMAQAVGGLLAIVPEMSEAEPAARKACERVCSSLATGSKTLPDVLPLLQAGLRWPETGWQSDAHRAIDRIPTPANPSFLIDFVRRAETLLAIGDCRRARSVLQEIALHQRRNGSCPVPNTPSSTARLAHLACLWYKLGERERADLALAYVERRQQSDGGFPAALDGWLLPWSRLRDTWAAKYYLDAALHRVHAAFDARWQELPATIDPSEGRVEAVRRWMATLPAAASIADAGCGKGRFLRHLLREFPAAKFTGIDISAAMLSILPAGVAARRGSILRTGAADGEFDGVMAVETLEHSLVPERAIAELCRIVRPGGRILIVDKDLRKQPLSEHDPWERWVTAEQLTGWLAPYCCEIQVHHVAHREGRPGHDLFLAATATRRRPAPA